MSLYNAIKEGMVLNIGSHTFDTESIKKFARKFDPQPFHLDEVAAKDSVLGGLCASGWHSLAIWMRFNVENGRKLLATESGYDGPAAHFGMSPGATNIKWLRPVFAGDTISYRTTVTGKKRLRSRPGWGYIAKHNEGFNQHGDKVLEFDGGVFLRIDEDV